MNKLIILLAVCVVAGALHFMGISPFGGSAANDVFLGDPSIEAYERALDKIETFKEPGDLAGYLDPAYINIFLTQYGGYEQSESKVRAWHAIKEMEYIEYILKHRNTSRFYFIAKSNGADGLIECIVHMEIGNVKSMPNRWLLARERCDKIPENMSVGSEEEKLAKKERLEKYHKIRERRGARNNTGS